MVFICLNIIMRIRIFAWVCDTGQRRRRSAQSHKEFINVPHKQGTGLFFFFFLVIYSVFTGGYIFLYTLAVSQAQPSPGGPNPSVLLSVLIRSFESHSSLSPSMDLCCGRSISVGGRRESVIAMVTKPTCTDMDTVGLQTAIAIRRIHKAQSVLKGKGQIVWKNVDKPSTVNVLNLCSSGTSLW